MFWLHLFAFIIFRDFQFHDFLSSDLLFLISYTSLSVVGILKSRDVILLSLEPFYPIPIRISEFGYWEITMVAFIYSLIEKFRFVPPEFLA